MKKAFILLFYILLQAKAYSQKTNEVSGNLRELSKKMSVGIYERMIPLGYVSSPDFYNPMYDFNQREENTYQFLRFDFDTTNTIQDYILGSVFVSEKYIEADYRNRYHKTTVLNTPKTLTYQNDKNGFSFFCKIYYNPLSDNYRLNIYPNYNYDFCEKGMHLNEKACTDEKTHKESVYGVLRFQDYNFENFFALNDNLILNYNYNKKDESQLKLNIKNKFIELLEYDSKDKELGLLSYQNRKKYKNTLKINISKLIKIFDINSLASPQSLRLQSTKYIDSEDLIDGDNYFYTLKSYESLLKIDTIIAEVRKKNIVSDSVTIIPTENNWNKTIRISKMPDDFYQGAFKFDEIDDRSEWLYFARNENLLLNQNTAKIQVSQPYEFVSAFFKNEINALNTNSINKKAELVSNQKKLKDAEKEKKASDKKIKDYDDDISELNIQRNTLETKQKGILKDLDKLSAIKKYQEAVDIIKAKTYKKISIGSDSILTITLKNDTQKTIKIDTLIEDLPTIKNNFATYESLKDTINTKIKSINDLVKNKDTEIKKQVKVKDDQSKIVKDTIAITNEIKQIGDKIRIFELLISKTDTEKIKKINQNNESDDDTYWVYCSACDDINSKDTSFYKNKFLKYYNYFVRDYKPIPNNISIDTILDIINIDFTTNRDTIIIDGIERVSVNKANSEKFKTDKIKIDSYWYKGKVVGMNVPFERTINLQRIWASNFFIGIANFFGSKYQKRSNSHLLIDSKLDEIKNNCECRKFLTNKLIKKTNNNSEKTMFSKWYKKYIFDNTNNLDCFNFYASIDESSIAIEKIDTDTTNHYWINFKLKKKN